MNIDDTQAAAQAAPSSPLEAPANKPEEQIAAEPSAAAQLKSSSSAAEDKAPAAQASKDEPENMNANVRIAKDSSVRKLISFVMGRLERGGTVTLQALNLCVKKAITISLIVRDRLGNIHQVNSLLVIQETKEADKNTIGDDEVS